MIHGCFWISFIYHLHYYCWRVFYLTTFHPRFRQCNGELYIYAARDKQKKGFCSKYRDCKNAERYPCNMCNDAKGVSFGRGTFRFQPGKWHNIKLSLVLNDVGKANGYVELRVDGQLVTSYDQMVWRNSKARESDASS